MTGQGQGWDRGGDRTGTVPAAPAVPGPPHAPELAPGFWDNPERIPHAAPAERGTPGGNSRSPALIPGPSWKRTGAGRATKSGLTGIKRGLFIFSIEVSRLLGNTPLAIPGSLTPLSH